MSRIAVIGGGISGLSAAYYLSRKHEVSLFEKDSRVGGHTNTITVQSSKGPLPVDTGFIVHNDRTYPNFCRLLEELKVPVQWSDMSWAVTSPGGGFEYSSHGVGGFFAQRSNLFRPGHYGLLREILRFNREAPKVLEDGAGGATRATIGDFIAEGRYGREFVERYLYPMAAAVWSTPTRRIGEFPLVTLIRFFQNHGMLGIKTHPRWKTIPGGSNTYLAPITAPYRERVHRNAGVKSVARHANHVEIRFEGDEPRRFDRVVFACHGAQVLGLLADATPAERAVFAGFETTRNEACLHTDSSLLPKRAGARASWNYSIGDEDRVTLTYHMNRLQALPVPEDYCVSLNATDLIAPDKIVTRIVYHHPLYTHAAIDSQARWAEVSCGRTHYCGAYWFYGFHEDGVRSALRVAEAVG